MNPQKNTLFVASVGLAYLVGLVLVFAVRVFLPSYSFQVLRIVGLAFTILGALYQVTSKALRTQEEIDRASTPTLGRLPIMDLLIKETKIARTAMVLILLGFMLQLAGNLG